MVDVEILLLEVGMTLLDVESVLLKLGVLLIEIGDTVDLLLFERVELLLDIEELPLEL